MANQLEHEDSPYLQKHKDDLVVWWPWCDEAFDEAQKQNKAIFISVGYSASHWCQVMQEEIFNNQACADLLNESFISIKVDRDERPDIARYYQKVYQLLNNETASWPTTIFATPQNRPFFARAYMRADSIEGSNEGIGFLEMATIVAGKIKDADVKLFENADEIESFLKKIEHPKEATVLKEEFYKNFMLQAKQNYDAKNGGFGSEPKFPYVSLLASLHLIVKTYEDDDAKEMLFASLNAMHQGGFYDLVDGGFFPYVTDAKWSMPHFEKRLYDNALLAEIYLDAYSLSGNERYLESAKESVDFWLDKMSQDSLLFSFSDATQNYSGGLYYTFEYQEVFESLSAEGLSDVAKKCELLSITPEGNFQGRNIIRLSGKKPSYFPDVQKVLKKLRAQKSAPSCDKRVHTSYSAMMIYTLFKLSSVDASYKEKASKVLETLLDTFYINGQLYHTTILGKTPKVKAFLEDYAYLSRALLTSYKHSGDELHLINAQRMINKALEEFYKKGYWSFSGGEYATKAQIDDNSYMSAVSIIVESMLTLGELLKDEKYIHFAFKTLEYNSYEIGRKPIYSAHMLSQVIRYVRG